MNETRQSLLLRAQTGETGAWKDLLDLYRRVMRGWLHRQGVPAGDLEDLSQEVRGRGSTPGRPGAERGDASGSLARRAAPGATAGSRPGRSAGSALTPLPRTRA